MIVGVGVDIVDIKRFERSIVRYDSRFLQRIFCADEIAYCRARARGTEHFAVRFAAKEAVLKALRYGLGPGISLREIHIRRGDRGEPYVELTGRTGRLAESKGVRKLHVSLSHSENYAVAQVVAEG